MIQNECRHFRHITHRNLKTSIISFPQTIFDNLVLMCLVLVFAILVLIFANNPHAYFARLLHYMHLLINRIL